jgi:hypothetical protein
MYDCKAFCATLNTGLYNLLPYLRAAGRTEATTVEAFLVDLTGNRNAATMLRRLLHWFPKAKKAGGWVYKSWRDWKAETGLSRDQVKRVHHQGHLEKVGIVRKIMKANGNPTVHYLLEVEVFLGIVAAFAGTSIEQVRVWMAGEETKSEAVNAPVKERPAPSSCDGSRARPEGENAPLHAGGAPQSLTTAPAPRDTQETEQQPHTGALAQAPDPAGVVAKASPPDDEPRFKKLAREEEENQRAIAAIFGREKQVDIPGVGWPIVDSWVNKWGLKRVQAVVQYAKKQKNIRNIAGFVYSELAHDRLKLREPEPEPAFCDGERYVTGKYAAWIEQ